MDLCRTQEPESPQRPDGRREARANQPVPLSKTPFLSPAFPLPPYRDLRHSSLCAEAPEAGDPFSTCPAIFGQMTSLPVSSSETGLQQDDLGRPSQAMPPVVWLRLGVLAGGVSGDYSWGVVKEWGAQKRPESRVSGGRVGATRRVSGVL